MDRKEITDYLANKVFNKELEFPHSNRVSAYTKTGAYKAKENPHSNQVSAY